MTIPLVGSGGLFTRLGAVGGIVNAVNALRGSTVPPKIDALHDQYATADRQVVEGVYSSLSAYQSTPSAFLRALQSLARDTVTAMVARDTTPTDSSLATALKILIAQMKAASQTVRACGISASVTPGGSNAGNPVVVASVKDPYGRVLENVFAESAPGAVTSDAVSGGATRFQEILTFRGLPQVGDPLSWAWPAGSGASRSLACIDPLTQSGSGGTRNWLRNSSFETFTVANVPDSWVIAAGAAGTTVLKAVTTFYDGAAGLKFVGDSSTLTAVYQEFNDSSTGTPQKLTSNGVMAWNVYVRTDVAPAAGVFRVALVDGSGAVVNDDAGTPNSASVNLPGLTAATWTSVSGFFRLPAVPPAVVRLSLGLTTALSTGTTLRIDRAAMATATQFYRQGPYLAAFSGSSPSVSGDTFTLTVANDNAGQFQRLFERLFGMRSLGLTLPSAASGSETVPDSLIA